MALTERVPVLMYHRVGEVRSRAEQRYAIAPHEFAAQMEALAGSGYSAVGIDALVAWLDAGPALPANTFVLTFDDGFKGVRDHALPILERLGWPFTVFLVSDLIGLEDRWIGDGDSGRRTHPLLDSSEIRDMCGRGASFQSHTRSHRSLTALDDAALAQELVGSREALSALLDARVDLLAYPFGHVDDRVESAARTAGYRAAFSVQPGFNRLGVNPFRIRRLDVFGTDTPAMLVRKIRLGSNDGRFVNAAGYYIGRLRSHMTGVRK